VLRGASAGRASLLEPATCSFARGLAWAANFAIVCAVRIAIGVRNFTALRPDQKLFAHFGETGTAIFAVEQVEYGRHDRPLRLMIAPSAVTTPRGMPQVIWITIRRSNDAAFFLH
jgi:hypothetical protein